MRRFVQEDKLFKKFIQHVDVSALQKRGVFHAHCKFFLESQPKDELTYPVEIYKIVRAEIPPEAEQKTARSCALALYPFPVRWQDPTAVCMVNSGKEEVSYRAQNVIKIDTLSTLSKKTMPLKWPTVGVSL